jgi:dTDP-glucose pyrophosphorylase
MKALVLAGGRGSRLEEKTTCTNKCLLDLNGRPVIEYNLDRAVEAGVDEILLLVGHCAEQIINRYGILYHHTPIRYVIQWEQKGLVHAIESCTNELGTHDFFLLLGDEVIVGARIQEMVSTFFSENPFVLCGIIHQPVPEKISRTYTVLTSEGGRVLRLIEKPRVAVNTIQGTGHCIFKNEILQYIERTPIHPVRGEKELPDLIQCAVDDGRVVSIFEIGEHYTNINFKDDLEEALRFYS